MKRLSEANLRDCPYGGTATPQVAYHMNVKWPVEPFSFVFVRKLVFTRVLDFYLHIRLKTLHTYYSVTCCTTTEQY